MPGASSTNIPTVIVEEVDGSPSSACRKIVFPNGTVSITSGVATYSPAAASTILAGGATSGGTGTQYASTSASLAVNPTENTLQAVAPYALTAQKLYVIIHANASATQNTVIVLRVNGADTGLTVTILAGGTAGTVYSDLSNTAAVAAGDKLSYSVTTGGGQSNPEFTATFEVVK